MNHRLIFTKSHLEYVAHTYFIKEYLGNLDYLYRGT